jgi:hypothetical protein
MDGQERLIKRLFMERTCHHCGSSHRARDVLVLARRRKLWLVMVTCLDCQQKDIYVVKLPSQSQGLRRITSYRLSQPFPGTSPSTSEELASRSASDEPPAPTSPVSTDDVLDMHLFLNNFNGDFRQLFTEVE